MTKWCDLTPEGRQKSLDCSKKYRQEHYQEVIEKERQKNKRYREANREKIREKARAKYVQVRELAGKPVKKEYNPRKPRDEEAPVVLPRKFGSLDKICVVPT